MTGVHHGSCLCGAVTFEVRGDLGEIGHCHCDMCQKAHGAAYGTYVNVSLDDLKFTSGTDAIGRYQSSPTVVRTFCRHCGSTLQFIRDGQEDMGVAAGLFNTELPGANYEVFTSRAHPWGDRHGVAMSHPTHPGYQGDD